MNIFTTPVILSRIAFLRPAPIALMAAVALMAPGFLGTAQAASAPQASTLTFDVTARFSTVPASANGVAGTQQKVGAKVFLSGQRARVETNMSGHQSTIIYSAPFLYRLLPEAKAGVRWKIPSPATQQKSAFAAQEILRNPTKIRALLNKYGAKRTGVSSLDGVPVEIYQITQAGGPLRRAKAWIRRSDALPVRLEAALQSAQVVASWHNYARPKSLSAGLFTPPADFKVRDARTAPPQMLF